MPCTSSWQFTFEFWIFLFEEFAQSFEVMSSSPSSSSNLNRDHCSVEHAQCDWRYAGQRGNKRTDLWKQVLIPISKMFSVVLHWQITDVPGLTALAKGCIQHLPFSTTGTYGSSIYNPWELMAKAAQLYLVWFHDRIKSPKHELWNLTIAVCKVHLSQLQLREQRV